MAETKQETYTQAEEPAQSPVERVTEKVKDPKKWQPGVPALPPGRPSKNDCSNSFGEPRNHFVPPPATERREGLTNWTPWNVGACLTGGALVFLRNAQTRSPASVAAGPVDSAPKQPVDKPPGAKQLKTSPDPFYME